MPNVSAVAVVPAAVSLILAPTAKLPLTSAEVVMVLVPLVPLAVALLKPIGIIRQCHRAGITGIQPELQVGGDAGVIGGKVADDDVGGV